LLKTGAAYRDYATPEETASEREAAEKEKRDFTYSRQWMAETDEQAAAFEEQGRKCIVRLKMPREGVCEFVDAIRGPVSFEWAREQDHVIQRNDGTCLYHLASVVDDYDFKITHVVRAIEHLSNTPRQIFIAQSLGYPLPIYGHIPFVAEPGSKTKMSKRKIEQYLKNKDFKSLVDAAQSIADRIGLKTTPETFNPVLVDFYKRTGYLPEAINNYLLLLGWSLDDHTEEFSREAMIRDFSLERVVKSEASFDPAKLLAFQQRYMNRMAIADKVEHCLPFLLQANLVQSDTPAIRERVAKVIEAAGDRITVSGDIIRFDELFVDDAQLSMDEKAFEKRFIKSPESGPLLEAFKKQLGAATSFKAADLEGELNAFVESTGVKLGDIMNPLRIALSGKSSGVGVFEMLEILGQESSIHRIDAALERLRQNQVAAQTG
jgi:glutamyl-tRNA synthetase